MNINSPVSKPIDIKQPVETQIKQTQLMPIAKVEKKTFEALNRLVTQDEFLKKDEVKDVQQEKLTDVKFEEKIDTQSQKIEQKVKEMDPQEVKSKVVNEAKQEIQKTEELPKSEKAVKDLSMEEITDKVEKFAQSFKTGEELPDDIAQCHDRIKTEILPALKDTEGSLRKILKPMIEEKETLTGKLDELQNKKAKLESKLFKSSSEIKKVDQEIQKVQSQIKSVFGDIQEVQGQLIQTIGMRSKLQAISDPRHVKEEDPSLKEAEMKKENIEAVKQSTADLYINSDRNKLSARVSSILTEALKSDLTKKPDEVRAKIKDIFSQNGSESTRKGFMVSDFLMMGSTEEIKNTIADMVKKNNPELAKKENQASLDDMVGKITLGLIESSKVKDRVNKDTIPKMDSILASLPENIQEEATNIIKTQVGEQKWDSFGVDPLPEFSLTNQVLTNPQATKKDFINAFTRDCENIFSSGELKIDTMPKVLKILVSDIGNYDAMGKMGIEFEKEDFTKLVMTQTKDKNLQSLLKGFTKIEGNVQDFIKKDVLITNLKDLATTGEVDLKTPKLREFLLSKLPPDTPMEPQQIKELYNKTIKEVNSLPTGDKRAQLNIYASKLQLLERTLSPEGQEAIAAYKEVQKDPGEKYTPLVNSIKEINRLYDSNQIDQDTKDSMIKNICNQAIDLTKSKQSNENVINEKAMAEFLKKVMDSDFPTEFKKDFYSLLGETTGFDIAGSDVNANVKVGDTRQFGAIKDEFKIQLKESKNDKTIKNEEGKTGVCRAFYNDSNRATYVISDNEYKRTISARGGRTQAESVEDLFAFCNNDPKLTFAVSQVANQAALGCLLIASTANGGITIDGNPVIPTYSDPLSSVSYNLSKNQDGDIVIKASITGNIKVINDPTAGNHIADTLKSQVDHSATIIVKKDLSVELQDIGIKGHLTLMPMSRLEKVS